MADGYHHLTYGSRCQIYALRKSGLSIRGVARALEVSASTVSRELRRNRGRRGYRMKQAQRYAALATPGFGRCRRCSTAVRAVFWATARRRKCLARPWRRPVFPVRFSARRRRGRIRRRGRLDRPASPVRGLRRRRPVLLCTGCSPPPQPGRGDSETGSRAVRFSARAMLFGSRPNSEKHRPNPTGCYAALQLRREITA